jgi:hypothetical protein
MHIVRVRYGLYRPVYEVVDTTSPVELEIVAWFAEIGYDGKAPKRAQTLADELNEVYAL